MTTTRHDSTLNCPHDHTRMEKDRVAGVTTDRCNACGRLWLDDGEMQRLLGDGDTVKTADAGPFGKASTRAALGGHVCPRDGSELLEVKHPQRADVVIEVCPVCKGVLLDAGELRQIGAAAAPPTGGTWFGTIQKLIKW